MKTCKDKSNISDGLLQLLSNLEIDRLFSIAIRMSSAINYLYTLAHNTLFAPVLAAAYSRKLEAFTTKTELANNVLVPPTAQCDNCGIFWVPGWNVLVRISYGKRKSSNKTKKTQQQLTEKTKVEPQKNNAKRIRKKVLVYQCLSCHAKKRFDSLIQENDKLAQNMLNPNFEGVQIPNQQKQPSGKKQKSKIVSLENSKITKIQKSTMINTTVASDNKKISNKNKKSKVIFPKKDSSAKKKESLSLMDFMSSDS